MKAQSGKVPGLLAVQWNVNVSEITSQFRLFFYQMHLEALVGQIKCGGHSGNSSTYYQSIIVDLQTALRKRLKKRRLVDRHPDKIARFPRSLLRLVHVYPRTLIADVRHLEKVLVHPRLSTRIPKQRLVCSGTARGHYNTF